MEYPKINSLWKRNGWYLDESLKKVTNIELQKGRQDFIEGDYAEEAFANIRYWDVDEKVDGTNIRIYYSNKDGPKIEFKGRTEAANLPAHLVAHLTQTFTRELLDSVFHEENQSIILYGEGYGPKIQACGGNYREDAGFILFDVYINGWWLQRGHVADIAKRLGIPSVPYIGRMTEIEIVEFVKSKPLSRCSHIPQMMEGVIARSSPLLLLRNGKPLKFKLKCRDFP
jgi:ATP-dependent RNA circularization protein (DNA/RNA ligase family)